MDLVVDAERATLRPFSSLLVRDAEPLDDEIDDLTGCAEPPRSRNAFRIGQKNRMNLGPDAMPHARAAGSERPGRVNCG